MALVTGIKKMYNSAHIEHDEQYCHSFLWRNPETDRETRYICDDKVNMGDKPAGTISMEAFYLTAAMFSGKYPKASNLLQSSLYVDDIIGSVDGGNSVKKIAEEVDFIFSQASI